MTLSIDQPGFANALVILGAAGIVIPAFARFRISPIIGFILVGMLVGPHGLGAMAERVPWLRYVTIDDPEAIAPFAEFGIILLLFTIGLELSFKRLWSMRKLVFGVGALELFGGGALIALALILVANEPPTAALGLGIALALSSTAIVLPMVNLKAPVGRAALAMLLFEDVAIVPIIFTLGALAPHADGSIGALWQTVWQGAVVLIAIAVAGRFVLPRVFAQAARARSPELFLAASLLIVIVAALVTAAVGLSPIVGALIAGLVIAETDYREEVEHVILPFKGLALGVFMITIGMSLDLRAILADWQTILAAVGGVVVIKTVVTAALLRFAGARRGVAAEAGVLMASPSETTLIVLAAALQARLITAETAAFWQVVTAIGLTITPLLARVGHDIANRIERGTHGNDVEPDGEGRTLIVGFGRVGQMVAAMLQRHGQPYLAIEANIDTVLQAKRDGHTIRFGDVARAATFDGLHLDRAKAVVLTMNDPVQQVRMTRAIRAAYPDLAIVTRARDADHAAELYRAGATDAVPETLESSLQLSEAVLIDLGVAMGPVIASVHDVRAAMRRDIMDKGKMDSEPRFRRLRPDPEGRA